MAEQKITLTVANDKLNLNVDSEEERFFREAEKEIEETLMSYFAKYPKMPLEKAMRYALVGAVVSKLRKEGKDSELEKDLDRLHSDLDDVLLKHS